VTNGEHTPTTTTTTHTHHTPSSQKRVKILPGKNASGSPPHTHLNIALSKKLSPKKKFFFLERIFF
jgi:hypothetical protein